MSLPSFPAHNSAQNEIPSTGITSRNEIKMDHPTVSLIFFPLLDKLDMSIIRHTKNTPKALALTHKTPPVSLDGHFLLLCTALGALLVCVLRWASEVNSCHRDEH